MSFVLIGFKNCGKTSIGKLIAEKTNSVFIDTDSLIGERYQAEENQLLTVREIYQQKGPHYFRDLEKTSLLTLERAHNHVIATGGGSVFDVDNVAHLKKLGQLIYLYASLETLLTRLLSQGIPAYLDATQLEKDFSDLYQQRENIYKQIADREISTENKSMLAIAEGIYNGE